METLSLDYENNFSIESNSLNITTMVPRARKTECTQAFATRSVISVLVIFASAYDGWEPPIEL
jgi:hypothetical protein